MSAKFALRIGAIILALLPLGLSAPGDAQTSTSVGIKWEVKSRFRLFKNEDNFQYLARFHGPNGVLAAEAALAADTKGNGWARQVVSQLCVDDNGQVPEFCTRDYSGHDASDRENVREDYLAPADHRIGVKADSAPPGALCTWKFLTDGNDATAVVKKDRPCGDEVFDRAAYGKTTQVQLFVATHPEDAAPTATTTVKVRDILIAGLGDSTAAGEGNPDRPVALADNGFCFRRFLSNEFGSYFRPNRAGYSGNRSCIDDNDSADNPNWAKERAHWMNAACHRSLYSYQLRLALALAIENPQISVTFIPLACTGATIQSGILGPQEARERDCNFGTGRTPCSHSVNGQMDSLNKLLETAHQRDKDRNLDLVLLTVGANDIGFSGLVANVMIDHSTAEFGLFKKAGLVSDVKTSKQKLNGLPGGFASLRTALKRTLDNKMERVIFVSYGHPALYNNGETCPATRQGFDVHPVFKIDGTLLKATSDFVANDFFPRLKAFATCDQGGGCRSVDQDRMTFVDDHQTQFKNHGFCAQADDDPTFDRECFKANGGSFKTDPNRAESDPLVCPRPASSFHAYLSRQRWIRTANDSYFAAMTYPTGLPIYLQPSDIHDPIWGATSAVYGGAMHPTAQGYAAIADAALPAARRLLGLPAPH